MPSRLKDLRLRFPYDDQDFREKYTPGHVSPSSLKYTGDESKGPRAANASLKNNHPASMALCMGDHRVGDTSGQLAKPQEMGLARRGFTSGASSPS